jgi:hypothetical protein
MENANAGNLLNCSEEQVIFRKGTFFVPQFWNEDGRFFRAGWLRTIFKIHSSKDVPIAAPIKP